MRKFLLLGIAAATAAFVTPASAQDTPKGDVANGKRVYLAVGCIASLDDLVE